MPKATTVRPNPPHTPSPREGGRLTAALADGVLVEWLRQMLLIREFENRCGQAYQAAHIGGFCHLYTGQEAAAVGTLAAVNGDDPVVTAYRDHGHALARGMDPKACMAEMYGRISGCAKGKGGSMHMFDKPHWLFGGHGIVGAQTPLGAGLAFAARYEWEVLGHSLENPGTPAGSPAKKKVALCYLGDGALNQGALHEAMNLAGLLSLPVIYIVENNGYSMGTSIERGTTMAHDLPKKAAAYGIEGVIINGFDVLELYDSFKPLVDRCRAEQRPAFVDLKTYRYLGHSMSDPQKYRTKEEVDGYKGRDSIDRLAHHLMSERRASSAPAVASNGAGAANGAGANGAVNGSPSLGGDGLSLMPHGANALGDVMAPEPGANGGGSGPATGAGGFVLSEAQFLGLQKQVREVVREAIEFAEKSPWPDAAAELYSDVVLNPHPGLSPSGQYIRGAKNPLL